MTGMPEMVAALNGFGGIASALVAGVEMTSAGDPGNLPIESQLTILFALRVGAATFSGSFVAFGKLQGIVSGAPLVYRGQPVVNTAITLGALGLVAAALIGQAEIAYWALGLVA